MIILGVDPGYDRLGVAILERAEHGERLIFSACLEPKAATLTGKFAELGANLESIIGDYRPTVLVMEKIFFSTNQKTALAVSEARGMIRYVAARGELKIIELTPIQIKQTIAGYGRATKDQVANMVRRLIVVPPGPRRDDELDAIAIALAGSAVLKF